MEIKSGTAHVNFMLHSEQRVEIIYAAGGISPLPCIHYTLISDRPKTLIVSIIASRKHLCTLCRAIHERTRFNINQVFARLRGLINFDKALIYSLLKNELNSARAPGEYTRGIKASSIQSLIKYQLARADKTRSFFSPRREPCIINKSIIDVKLAVGKEKKNNRHYRK